MSAKKTYVATEERSSRRRNDRARKLDLFAFHVIRQISSRNDEIELNKYV